MIQLPNNKKCYNLPEQVAQNLLNIQYLAEQYANIDELPSIWADYKTAFDADLHTFEDWTTTFEGWENTLATYLANMSSAAVGALAGQDVSVKTIAQTDANYNSAPYISDSTAVYNRFQVINGILYVILNFKVVNNTGSEHTYYVFNGDIYIPPSYGAKIIDFEGDNATVAKAQKTVICGTKGYGFSSVTATTFNHDIHIAIRNHTSANYLDITVTAEGGITLQDGEEYYITGRIALSLF